MTDSEKTYYANEVSLALAAGDSILGVLTGQVPVRDMPIAGQYTGAPLALDGEWVDDDGSA